MPDDKSDGARPAVPGPCVEYDNASRVARLCPRRARPVLCFHPLGRGLPEALSSGTRTRMVQSGASWCSLAKMAERAVRQSVSIPTGLAKRVRTLAKSRKTSANRVIVDLIEVGLQSKEAEKERFFSLVKRLTESQNAAERQRLKDELARMTFGD